MRLREFTTADIDLLTELDADPEVMRYINGGEPTPRSAVEHETLPEFLADYRNTPGFGHFAAVDQADGTFIGWFALTARPQRAAELGYRLRKPYWGCGLATEGARALVRRGFTTLGRLRIEATTMAVNTGSRKVLERCGFRLVRTEFGRYPDPIPGAGHGDVDYVIERTAWSGPDR